MVGGLTIAVGDKTSLHDWFVAPAEYLGLLDGNKMIFYLGEDNGTLFDEGLHYYDVTYRITENRIGKSYKTGTFRDRFFRDKNVEGSFGNKKVIVSCKLLIVINR